MEIVIITIIVATAILLVGMSFVRMGKGGEGGCGGGCCGCKGHEGKDSCAAGQDARDKTAENGPRPE